MRVCWEFLDKRCGNVSSGGEIKALHVRRGQVMQGSGFAFGDTRRKWAPFRGGHLPYPTDYRPAFAFSGILCPLARPPSLRSGYHPEMGTMGFTQLIEIDTCRGEVGLYSPVERTGAAAGRDRSGGPLHIAVWLRPISLLAASE
jgi:hypothetical protein